MELHMTLDWSQEISVTEIKTIHLFELKKFIFIIQFLIMNYVSFKVEILDAYKNLLVK